MNNEIRVAVVGVGGRMGQALGRAVDAQQEMHLTGAIDRPDAPVQGQDAGVVSGTSALGVEVTADPLPVFANCDAVLDFTAPEATIAYSELAAQARIVHVIGTTGFSDDDEEKINAAARHARIIKSGNMSLGVNLLAGLVRRAAAALGPEFDIEIVEMHHRHKVDAPSGTALLLGEAAADSRQIDLAEHSVRTRDGHTGPREQGSIGFATLRGGSVVGDHTVVLAGEGERIELTHRAQDRTVFANGAVRAARWGQDKTPGLYSMADVLGLT